MNIINGVNGLQQHFNRLALRLVDKKEDAQKNIKLDIYTDLKEILKEYGLLA